MAFISAGLYSCSSNIERTNEPKRILTAKDFSLAGVAHNKLLDESYNYLKASNNLKEGKKGLKKFIVHQINLNKKLSQRTKNAGVKFVNNFHVVYNGNIKSAASDTSTSAVIDTLSEQVKFYFNKMNNIIKTSSKSTISQNITTLENNIQEDNTLTNKQLSILYSATEVAKYSSKYWSKNIDKWRALAKDNSSETLATFSGSHINVPTCFFCDVWNKLKGVVVADAESAAGTAILNLAGPIGTIAWADVIGMGAVTGSAFYEINEAIEAL